jgi:hypothetical protein
VECPECESPAEHAEHVQIQAEKKRVAFESEQRTAAAAEARKQARKQATRSFFAFAALIAAGWFLCRVLYTLWITPAGSDSVLTSVTLSQAQIEATRQAEIAQRTAAFEDIVVRIGEIKDLEKEKRPGNDAWEYLFATYPVIVANHGPVAHSVLLSFGFQEHNGNRTDPVYREITILPGETFEFEVRHNFGYTYDFGGASSREMLTDNAWFFARLESVDGVDRELTSRASSREEQWGFTTDWDFEIEIHASPNYVDYHYPGE